MVSSQHEAWAKRICYLFQKLRYPKTSLYSLLYSSRELESRAWKPDVLSYTNDRVTVAKKNRHVTLIMVTYSAIKINSLEHIQDASPSHLRSRSHQEPRWRILAWNRVCDVMGRLLVCSCLKMSKNNFDNEKAQWFKMTVWNWAKTTVIMKSTMIQNDCLKMKKSKWLIG